MCVKCAEAFNKLIDTFGKDAAEILLWEATCYPMDGEICLKQVETLVERHKSTGITADQILQEAEEEMNQCMKDFRNESSNTNSNSP